MTPSVFHQNIKEKGNKKHWLKESPQKTNKGITAFHQIETKKQFSLIVPDEQICEKFREGGNIKDIVIWYSNVTGKEIEESKKIIVRFLLDRKDMADYVNEILFNTDYYNYIMEGTPSTQNPNQIETGGGCLKLQALY